MSEGFAQFLVNVLLMIVLASVIIAASVGLEFAKDTVAKNTDWKNKETPAQFVYRKIKGSE